MKKRSLKKTAAGLAGKIREAIGAGPNDEITVVMPQFERPASWPAVAAPPADREAFDALLALDRNALLELGLTPWDDREGGTRTLWLFPGEWYGAIPEGYPIHVIDGRAEAFRKGVTDDDTRFGALAFGIIGAKNEKRPR